jgi:hypothetical protein
MISYLEFVFSQVPKSGPGAPGYCFLGLKPQAPSAFFDPQRKGAGETARV